MKKIRVADPRIQSETIGSWSFTAFQQMNGNSSTVCNRRHFGIISLTLKDKDGRKNSDIELEGNLDRK